MVIKIRIIQKSKKSRLRQERIDEITKWKECKLGDVADIVGGGTPSTKDDNFWNGKIPWITPRDLSNFSGRYISNGERNISELGLANSSAKIVPEGTVLLSSRAPVGYLAISLNDITTNQGFRSLIPNSKTNSLFLYYFLKNNVDYLKSQSTGTTFGELAGSTLKSLFFLFPPLDEQKAIASVLSCLDDKIDLLHRQNKTLEAMAETLFRQWFVEEADEQSDIQIPLGTFIDSISISHKFPKNQIIFLNTSDIYLGNVCNVLTNEYLDINLLPGQAKKSIQKNDILFSEIRPANGRWAFIDFDAEDYVVSTKLMVLRSKGEIEPAFVYFYLTHSMTTDWLQLVAESRSGTFPQITFDQIKELKLNIPSEKFLKNAEEWCRSNLQKILFNQNQIRTLEKLRDTLLPKLMSGDVRVEV